MNAASAMFATSPNSDSCFWPVITLLEEDPQR